MGKLDEYKNYIKRVLGRKEDADDEESMSEERPRLKWDDKAKRMLWVPTPPSDDDPDIYGLTGEQPKAMPHPEGLFGVEGGGGTQGLRNQPVDPRFMEEIMKPPGESFAFAPLTDEEEKIKWPNMQNDSAVNKLLKAGEGIRGKMKERDEAMLSDYFRFKGKPQTDEQIREMIDAMGAGSEQTTYGITGENIPSFTAEEEQAMGDSIKQFGGSQAQFDSGGDYVDLPAPTTSRRKGAIDPISNEERLHPNVQNSALNKLLKATNEFEEPFESFDDNDIPDEEFKFNSYGEQIGGPVDEPNPQWDNYAQGSAAHSVAVDQGWGGTEPDISNYSEEGIYSGDNNSAHDVKTFAEGFLGTHGLSLTDANGEPIQDIFNYHGIKTGETPVTSQHITDYVRSTVGQTDPFKQPPSAVDKLLKATEKDKKFLQEYFNRLSSGLSGSDYYENGEDISPHASFAIGGEGVRDDWEGEEVKHKYLPKPDEFKSPSELQQTDPQLPHTKKRGKEPNIQNTALDKLRKAVGTPPPEGMDEEELDRVFREMMMEEYGRVLSQQEWLDMKADEKTKGERADEVLQKPTKPHNWLDYWSRQEVGSEPEFTGGQTIHPSTRDMMEMTESDKWKKLKPWEQRGLSSEEVIPEPGKMPPNIQNTALDKLLKAIDSNIEDPSKDYWHSVGEGTQHPFTRFGPTFLGDEGGIGAWSTEAGEIGSQPWEFAIADYSGASMDKYWENIKNILEHQAQMDKTSGKDPAINPESKLENMQTDGNSSVLWEQFNRKEGM